LLDLMGKLDWQSSYDYKPERTRGQKYPDLVEPGHTVQGARA
jgi:hypothetical protein